MSTTFINIPFISKRFMTIRWTTLSDVSANMHKKQIYIPTSKFQKPTKL